jgi:hypothetical protein
MTLRNDETGNKFKTAIEQAMNNVAGDPNGIRGFAYSLCIAKLWRGTA